MRLLLDSNVLLASTRGELKNLEAKVRLVLLSPANDFFVSVASLWEIAIKTRLGKLDPKLALRDIPRYLSGSGFITLGIDERHALEELPDPPATRDPFDRLLLAQCEVENMRLLTMDRVLVGHRLAWREI